MATFHGQMTSFNNAIRWAESMPDSADKQHSINRMKYERDKAVPVKPKYHKGLYGKKFDYYTCGQCGATISEAHWHYCPNCGFAIGEKVIN